MLLEHLRRLALHRLIRMRLRSCNLDGLAVELKPTHVLDGVERALLGVEHDEGLALALERALGDDVEDRAVVLEDAREGFFHGVDFHALFEVGDLEVLGLGAAVCNACASEVLTASRDLQLQTKVLVARRGVAKCNTYIDSD
jgi:hypothetical protein